LNTKRRRDRGQALVEFSLVLIPFLWILMGIVDLGRGIYTYNAVGQAARELGRATSVHTCNTSSPTCTLGTSPETAKVLGTQQKLVPGLAGAGSSVTYACTTVSDSVLSSVDCPSGAFVRVTVTVPFGAVTPFLGGFLPSSLSSSTHIQVP
jgi:Flp pilus assembly protein TadG